MEMKPRRTFQTPLGWLVAIGGTAVVTLIGHELHPNPGAVGFAFLVVVLFASLRGGLLVGSIASILATLSYNFFFFEPLYTFRLADPSQWITLAALLVTSVTVTRLVLDARTQADEAEHRRTELETLYQLSVDLFGATNRVGALGEATGRALTLLGAREGGLVLLDGQSAAVEPRVVWWVGQRSSEVDAAISKLQKTRAPIEVPSGVRRDVYLPLIIGDEMTGALVARDTDASMRALVSASGLVALAVEREKFIEENAHVEALRESETLKTSLLRAISHDLATPLTAITTYTDGLRRRSAGDEELDWSVRGIADETGRLKRRIENLLAMARLEAGKSTPRREPTPAADIFHAVRENLPLVFEARPVIVRVEDDTPDIYIDPSLTLEILVNLVENAHRVSPRGTPVELIARRHPIDEKRVRLEVRDRGPGFPPGVIDVDGNLIAGAITDVAQRGLGLEIARGLAAANGGAIGLEQREGGGAVARIDLPAAVMPVTTDESEVV